MLGMSCPKNTDFAMFFGGENVTHLHHDERLLVLSRRNSVIVSFIFNIMEAF